MKLFRGLGLITVLLAGSQAQAEIEITAGKSEASVLGDGQAAGTFKSFEETKVTGQTIVMQGVVRPFSMKQFGIGLRWQNSSFRSFHTQDKLGRDAGSDAIRLQTISPVLALQFEPLSNVLARISLSSLSYGDAWQAENAQTQTYMGSSGFHFDFGAAYRLTENSQVSLLYSYMTMNLRPNGSVAGTRLTQISPSGFLVGLTFGS